MDYTYFMNVYEHMYNINNIDNIDENNREIQSQFQNLICNGTNQELIDFYDDNKDRINLSHRNEQAFLISCKRGKINIIKWLFEVKKDINILIFNELPFMTACSNGFLDIAEFIYEKYKEINHISDRYEEAFFDSCISPSWMGSNDNIEISKWLLKIKPDIDISRNEEKAFRNACTFGKLNIAKWLLEIKPDINIVILNNFAFVFSCIENHIEVVQWLLQIKPDIYESYHNESIFRECCKWGNLDILKLLYEKIPISVIDNSVNFNLCFYIACKYIRNDIIHWLLEKKPDIDMTFNNNKAFYKVSNYENIDYNLIKLFLDKNPTMIETIDSYKINLQVKEYILSLGYTLPLKWIDIIKNSNNLIECPICSEQKNEYIETPCNHKFCKGCIERWISTNNKCPYCRSKI